MALIADMQKAVAFMEAHLLDGITYEEVAAHLCLSPYHFHRMFKLTTGTTPSVYMRNRRLSLAGEHLTHSDDSIIEVAFRYGYECPESFSRAFARFRGMTPLKAKRTGAPLKSYNRLVLKMILEGGQLLDYRVEKRAAFDVLCKVRAFNQEETSKASNRDIPDFWTACQNDGTFEAFSSDGGVYGLCSATEHASQFFDYGIGKVYTGGAVPEGYRVWSVPEALWAVFPCVGDDGACIGAMWERIFKEFLPGSTYEMAPGTDFEYYGASECFCEIWIPVLLKE